MFSSFFSNLELVFQKWTKINVHFQKSRLEYEKKKHHSFTMGGLVGCNIPNSLSMFYIYYIVKYSSKNCFVYNSSIYFTFLSDVSIVTAAAAGIA